MLKLITPFDKNQLQIIHTNKVYSPPPELIPEIENNWQHQLQKTNEKIWNGTIYRLDNYDQNHLYLGLTDYKHALASKALKEKMAELPFNERIHSMYIITFLKTTDQKYAFGIRSTKSEYGKKISLIGGTLNQDEKEMFSIQDIYDHLATELSEELSLSKDHISEIYGIGMYESRPNYRIGIFAHTTLNISSDKFKSIMKLNDEHEEIIFVNEEDIGKEISGTKWNEDIHITFAEYLIQYK